MRRCIETVRTIRGRAVSQPKSDEARPAEVGTAAYIRATAALLGLAIRPEWHDDVVANFELLATAAATIETVVPSDGVESALVFTA